MALLLSITLSISIVALILILGAKRYEMRTGKVFFARTRPSLERPLHAGAVIVAHLLPLLAQRSIMRGIHVLRSVLGHMIARVTLLVEHALHRMLGGIQQIIEPRHEGGQASAFLREVAEHKRKLLRGAPEKRAIFDES